MDLRKIIAVVGPTASGKSALSEELAVRRRSIVLEADSMQVYTGMDIGTAKMPVARRRVQHFGIDLVSPADTFSVARYQAYARGVLDAALAAGQTPVVCGGSGLYVRAALDVMEFPPGEQQDNPVRAGYEAYRKQYGDGALHRLLAERDPDSAKLLHPHNSRRVARALEMLDEGLSYARQAEKFSQRRAYYPVVYVALRLQREELYARIDVRVDQMIQEGLLGEVEALLAGGFREALTAKAAIGYKELLPVIEDGAPLAGAIADIKQATRRLAKRQLTWFRADERVIWLDADGRSTDDLAETASRIMDAEVRG
ncbi:MAG: tRNA (adenosine(37)-N6)-dimethylallyltransferase MiaA [Actinomycetes bacterium]|jgi:tRNA dimethylallyltransferase|nr:tRNA (adenosine(37)-N6)-dimethylallyltransferase MiaA [Actinomycetes bacterium]